MINGKSDYCIHGNQEIKFLILKREKQELMLSVLLFATI